MSRHILEHIPETPITLEENQSVTLCVGQLFLNVSHQPLEWQTEFNYVRPIEGKKMGQYGPLMIERYVVKEHHSQLTIEPLLANRPIVSRPMEPITIMPGSTATIFVGTPLFIAIKIGDITLREMPVVILSDTWFGRSTVEGELCYSTTTRARLNSALLKLDGFKAETPIIVTNSGEKSLTLDRINVPMPYLSLYRTQTGKFETSSIKVELEDNIINAKLSIMPPDNNHLLTKITDPSKPMQKKFFYRTLDLLFA